MLTALDHIVLICRHIDKGIGVYTNLLGTDPVWTAQKGGFSSAMFKVGNTALEIISPQIGTPSEARIHEILGSKEGALTSLAFRADNLSSARHTLTRRGLSPSAINEIQSCDLKTGRKRQWKSFRCEDDQCAGVKTFILELQSEDLNLSDAGRGGVTSLDHLVINTPNPERAIAHYGARLGLRFTLDRTIDAFKTRFLFFRVGGVTLEIIHLTDQEQLPNDPDYIWGLTWKVNDLIAARKRLLGSGLNISDIRTGRKPGTNVFTVRSGTLGIPTLFLAND